MLLNANAESGLNGAQLTGGGDFDIIANGSTGVTTYDNSIAFKGNMSYKTVAGTGNTYAAWSTSLGGNKNELWLRVYGMVTTYYSGGICHLRYSGGLAGKVGITSAGKFNVSSGANAFLQTSTVSVPTNTPFRLELHGIASASPTGGTLELRIFTDPESTTPTEILGPFTATQTATAFDQVWFGPVGGGSGATLYYDDVAASDTSWVGPSGTPTSPPVASSNPPVPVGSTSVGSVLTANSPGTWTGYPSPTYTYQWRRCDASGNNAVAIAGATAQTYTITSADLGSTLRIAVTATNSAGSATSASSFTSVVTAASSTVTSLTNTLNGPDGTSVTLSSTSATGDGLDDITITAGGSITFDSSNPSHTGAGVRVVSAGANAYVGWSNSVYGPVTKSYARMYLRLSAYPSGGAAVMRFRLGSTTAASINITAAGQLRIRNAAGTALASGTATIPLNTWVRLEGYVNASSTAGEASYRLYQQKDSVIVSEEKTTSNTEPFTDTVDTVQFGLVGNATSGDSIWIDELEVDTTWVGPFTEGAPRWGWGMVATPGVAVPPPPPLPPVSTVFGYNPNAPEGDYFASYLGKTPIARCYNNYRALPSNGSDFQPGGFAYNSANVGLAGHASGKRINMSVLYDPATVVDQNSALAVQLRNYAASVPSDWYVQVVLYHEYNLHTSDLGGDNDTERTTAQFVNSFPILANAIMTGDAGRGRCIPVINPSWGDGKFQNQMVPNAALMPAGSELHFDVYNNPSGNPSGYKAYGTTYRTAAQIMTNVYAAIHALGYDTASYGWGIDEFGAPRRVAPKLATLNTTLGWGPLSPHDIDGSGMAAAITDFGNWVLNAPVKPTTVIFFTGQGKWNQTVKTAGTANLDDGTSSSPGPNYQGFPISVSPTKPMNAYKAFIDISG